jgi:hypothetical protein
LLGVTDPGRAIKSFDNMGEAEVEDARNWLSADAVFRSAVTWLETR